MAEESIDEFIERYRQEKLRELKDDANGILGVLREFKDVLNDMQSFSQEFAQHRYQNPAAVNLLIDSMEKGSGKKFSEEEREFLSTNPALAERVFNSGLKDAIIKGTATITELSKLSPEAVASLTYAHSQAALNNGAIKVEQIGALSPEEVRTFSQAALDGNHEAVSKILGLNETQAADLQKSFDAADEAVRIEKSFELKAPAVITQEAAAKAAEAKGPNQ